MVRSADRPETSADRVDAGKPEHGKIMLNAFYEGGHIIIEISDDGRGLVVTGTKCVKTPWRPRPNWTICRPADQQLI